MGCSHEGRLCTDRDQGMDSPVVALAPWLHTAEWEHLPLPFFVAVVLLGNWEAKHRRNHSPCNPMQCRGPQVWRCATRLDYSSSVQKWLARRGAPPPFQRSVSVSQQAGRYPGSRPATSSDSIPMA